MTKEEIDQIVKSSFFKTFWTDLKEYMITSGRNELVVSQTDIIHYISRNIFKDYDYSQVYNCCGCVLRYFRFFMPEEMIKNSPVHGKVYYEGLYVSSCYGAYCTVRLKDVA